MDKIYPQHKIEVEQLYVLQSWTNVLGTVLQYSHFSVISRFPLKTVHSFQNLLAVLPPTTLYKVETRKKILDTRDQHCLWGEGRGWTCVNWKTPQKCKSVPRLLSMIVSKRGGKKKGNFEGFFKPLKVFFRVFDERS